MASEQLVRVLRRQHQVIGRDQALACGLTRAAIGYRLRVDGPWQKLLPGVYLTTTGAVMPVQREMAALLHAGPRSALTGLVAARRHGFDVPETSPIDVMVPVDVRRGSTGFVRIQRSNRMPCDVCVEGEIRYAMPARAVADAARSMMSARGVRALVAEAIQQQRCSIAMLEIELAEGPTKGSGALRAALEEIRDGVRSPPEGDLRTLIRRGKIPMPQFNARLYSGKTLVAVVDAWWKEVRVGVEVDSREYHYSVEDWQQTMARHDRLVAHGVLLLHFTPRQIRSQPDEVVARIRGALASGSQRPRLGVSTRVLRGTAVGR